MATGETWFGEDALARKLCDELKTVDDVLLEFLHRAAAESCPPPPPPPSPWAAGRSALLKEK